MAYRRPSPGRRILLVALTLVLVFTFAPTALAVIAGVAGVLSVLAILGYEPPSSTPVELRRRGLP